MARTISNTTNTLSLSRGGLGGNIVFDANQMQIGLEYNYKTTDLNLPRGNDDNLNEYVSYVGISNKRNSYNLIYDKNLLENKKLGFQNRIIGIQKHSIFLEAKSKALSINNISDPEISEIVLKISLSIASTIPILKPIGIVGNVYLAREEQKDKKKLKQLQNKILTDAKLLNLELASLKAIYNSIPEFSENGLKLDTSKDANINNSLPTTENKIIGTLENAFDSLAKLTGIDSLSRSANISNSKVFLGLGGIFLGVRYYLKNKKKKK